MEGIEEKPMLTIKDLARRTRRSESFFYNRSRTKAKTLKFVFERPLQTTEEYYQEWVKSLAKSKG